MAPVGLRARNGAERSAGLSLRTFGEGLPGRGTVGQRSEGSLPSARLCTVFLDAVRREVGDLGSEAGEVEHAAN